jgi:hypothetical protein
MLHKDKDSRSFQRSVRIPSYTFYCYLTPHTGRSRYPGGFSCRNWRSDHRSQRVIKDGEGEQAIEGSIVIVYRLDLCCVE